MKNLFILIIILLASLNLFADTAKEAIDKANKDGLTIFLVITEPGNKATQKAMDIADQAHEKAPKTRVIKVNRSEAAEIELISKYAAAGVPLPLIVVISNGVVCGIYYVNQASPDALVKAIPSPVKESILKALSDGKSVFLVVSRKNMTEKEEVMNTCRQACIEMQNNARLIALELDDPAEKDLISELKIDTSITSPRTYVINTGGKITGTFGNDVSSSTLVATAKKLPQAQGCSSPGGSGAGCGQKK